MQPNLYPPSLPLTSISVIISETRGGAKKGAEMRHSLLTVCSHFRHDEPNVMKYVYRVQTGVEWRGVEVGADRTWRSLSLSLSFSFVQLSFPQVKFETSIPVEVKTRISTENNATYGARGISSQTRTKK